jgi:O-antigen/teichoic acid export membrane protein
MVSQPLGASPRTGSGLLSYASVYLGANVLNAAIPFLLLPVLTRHLAPAEYGVVAMFEATVACLGVFTGLSVHGAVGVRYFSDDQSTFPEYVGVCLLVLVGSSLLTGVVLVAAGTVVSAVTGLGTQWLLIAAVVSFAQFLINIRLSIWQLRNEALRYGAFQISQTLVNAALSLLLVLAFEKGASGRMAGISTAVVACGLVALVTMQAGGWIRWKWNAAYFRDAVMFGLPLVPHTLGVLAVAQVDRFVITRNLGADATGVYFAAVQLSMPLLMLGSSFNRGFVPWLFGKLARNENAVAVLVSYMAIGVLLACGMLYALVLQLVLPLIVGHAYVEARPIALILVIGTSFQAAYYAVVNYVFYAKKTSYLAAITFSTGAIYVLGVGPVAANYGLNGVAMLFAMIQCATFLLVWLVGAKVSPQPWLDFSLMRAALRNRAAEGSG